MEYSGVHSFIFCFCYSACRILVPLPGIKPASPALEVQSLNHWTTREIPDLHSFLDPSAMLYVGDCFYFYGIRLLLSRTPPSPEFPPSSQVTSFQFIFLNVCWLQCLSSVLDVFLLPTNTLSRRLLFILKNLQICITGSEIHVPALTRLWTSITTLLGVLLWDV